MIFIIFIISIFQRNIYNIISKSKKNQADSFFHIYYINSIRNNSHIVPKYFPRFFFKIRTFYPFFVHWVLSFFNKKANNFIFLKLNPLIDSLFAAYLFYWAEKFFASQEKGVLCALIYIFTPQLFSYFTCGPRSWNFTPRLISEIIVFFFVYFLVLYVQEQSIFYFIISSFIFFIIFLTSEFSIQFSLFLTILLSLYYQNITYLFIPISGALFSIIVMPSWTKNFLVYKYKHLVWYYQSVREGTIGVSNRSLFLGLLKSIKKRNLAGIYKQIFYLNPFLSQLFKNPLVYTLLISLIFSSATINKHIDIQVDIFYLVFILFIITSIKPFTFLGESERYIVNYYPFISLLAVYIVPEACIYAIIFYGLIFQVIEIILYKIKNRKPVLEYPHLIIDFLRTYKETKKVVINPLYLAAWPVLSETNHRVLTPFECFYDEKNKYFSEYSKVNIKKIKELISEFGVDIIISTLDHEKEFDYHLSATKVKKIYLNKKVVVWETS